MPQDWKDLLQGKFADELDGVIALTYSPDLEADGDLPVVTIDRRRRAGKQVTLVSGFSGDEAALASLGQELKRRLGVGGSAKDGEILIQGDLRDKVVAILVEMGHSAKRGN